MFFRSFCLVVSAIALCATTTALSSSGDSSRTSKGRRVFVGTPVTQQPNHWVSDCMTANPLTLDTSTPTDEAIALLVKSGISCVPIVASGENKSLVGILSSHDFLQKQAFGGALLNIEGSSEQVQTYIEAAKKISGQRVEEVMTPNPVTVLPSATMRDAALIMSQQKLHHLPVVDKKQELVGILTSSDVMRDLLRVSKGLPEGKEQEDDDANEVSP